MIIKSNDNIIHALLPINIMISIKIDQFLFSAFFVPERHSGIELLQTIMIQSKPGTMFTILLQMLKFNSFVSPYI